MTPKQKEATQIVGMETSPEMATGNQNVADAKKGTRRVYFGDINDYRETNIYDGDQLVRKTTHEIGRVIDFTPLVEQPVDALRSGRWISRSRLRQTALAVVRCKHFIR